MREASFVLEDGEVRWEGPPVALVHAELLYAVAGLGEFSAGDFVDLGPYLVRLNHYDAWNNTWEVYRVDTHGWLIVKWRGLGRFGRMVWRRLILTLAVWKLANWPAPGCYPSWDDVRRRWAKKGSTWA